MQENRHVFNWSNDYRSGTSGNQILPKDCHDSNEMQIYSYELPMYSYELPMYSYELPMYSYELPMYSYELPIDSNMVSKCSKELPKCYYDMLKNYTVKTTPNIDSISNVYILEEICYSNAYLNTCKVGFHQNYLLRLGLKQKSLSQYMTMILFYHVTSQAYSFEQRRKSKFKLNVCFCMNACKNKCNIQRLLISEKHFMLRCGDIELNPGPTNTFATVLKSTLFEIGRQPVTILGDSHCFLRSISHQLYGTHSLHAQIKAIAIQKLNRLPRTFH